MGTYSAKPTDVKRTWYIIDASEDSLGRVSTAVATLLTGKKKPIFTPHIDCGDYVIVINSDKLILTGDKASKPNYRHTGFPGGIKQVTNQEQLEKDSTRIIEKAVRGMIPVNKLRDDRLKRLKVYANDQHNHHAQKPVIKSLKDVK